MISILGTGKTNMTSRHSPPHARVTGVRMTISDVLEAKRLHLLHTRIDELVAYDSGPLILLTAGIFLLGGLSIMEKYIAFHPVCRNVLLRLLLKL